MIAKLQWRRQRSFSIQGEVQCTTCEQNGLETASEFVPPSLVVLGVSAIIQFISGNSLGVHQRLNIGHIIASSPQAKGKIERSIGTFERRLLALFNQYKVSTFEQANTVAQEVIFWWNENHVNRTTKLTPNQSLEIATMRRKTAYTKHPQILLNIFVARHIARRVSRSNTIDFQGQVFQIAPTNHKMVYVVYHHDSKFWVIQTEIDTLNPKIPEILACYETQNSTFERPLWKKSISEAYSK